VAGSGCDKLTVAEILRRSSADYVYRYSPPPQVQSTLAKLSLCRTSALGGRRYRCGGCANECVVYNSCGDRHCPTCSGAKRSDWLDSASELILDGVDYFQVVFTLPSELSRLALGNRREIYDLLFASAWSALSQIVRSEQGYDPAAMMVLHTWNQKLDAHAHVHAVVPGGGPRLTPSVNGYEWKTATKDNDALTAGHYLVDADDLREAYRDAFLSGLNRLRDRGKLKLEGDFAHLQDAGAWQAFLDKLRTVTWVSYIQPPPASCEADHVLKYLARYLTGGPIADSRIIAADENEVTFLAREGTTTGGDSKQVPITLSTTEFTRRWSLHILPRGYTKTRRYGGWSNARRDDYLERCSKQLEAIDAPLSVGATEFGPFDPEESSEHSLEQPPTESRPCPECAGEMILQAVSDKPSWAHIMSSHHRPSWYEA
jgi:hypothetical protein